MLIRDWLRLGLGWGILLTAVGCGGRAGDNGFLVGATPPPMNSSTATNQVGTGVATSRAIGGGSSTGGVTTAGGATLGTGGAAACTFEYGDTPHAGLVSPELCGNGVVEVSNGEQCDDGNSLPGDGCSAACYVEPHWTCPVGCGPCERIRACGDGIIDWNEICDDGNTLGGDDCSADCQRVLPGPCDGPHCSEPSNCGDGIRQSGEDCDTGPRNEDDRYDGCSTACTLNIRCGDGQIQLNEQCDLGGLNGIEECGWGCTNECRNYAPCGDGIVQAECGEICDDGVNSGNPGSCSPGCITPRCGDGVVQPENGEECDVGSEDGYARPWPQCGLCQNVWMN